MRFREYAGWTLFILAVTYMLCVALIGFVAR
jgi:hypothetical protein